MATIQLGNTDSASRLISYCEQKALVKDGIDCVPEYAKSQFKATRVIWNKTTGVQAHHVIQAFKPGEINPEEANEIGLQLARQIALGHEVAVYTHANTEHIHNHIVINAVNCENGKKYQSKKKDLYRIREMSDSICREKGLSTVINKDCKVRYTLAEKAIIDKGQTSWKDEIRQVIDELKSSSKTYKEFKEGLKKYDIQVKETKKNISFKHPDKKVFVRGKTLGFDYERSSIENGFERQIASETNQERGNSDLLLAERANENSRGKQRTQRAHEGLHQGSYGRGHSEKTYTERTVIKGDENIKRDSREDDFDLKRARKHSKGLRQNFDESYEQWKDRDDQEQSNDIGKDAGDRDDLQNRRQQDDVNVAKQLKQSRTRDIDLSR